MKFCLQRNTVVRVTDYGMTVTRRCQTVKLPRIGEEGEVTAPFLRGKIAPKIQYVQ